MSQQEQEPGGHGPVEHVHLELALFDHRRTVERVAEALRTAGAIGFVEPMHSEGERIGASAAVIATAAGAALRAGGDGVEVGLPLPELAEWLRRRLSCGVIIHDDAGNQLAATVPQSVGEAMEAALNEPHAYPSVTVVQGVLAAEDIEDVAFMMGGPTALVPAGERSALVASTRRPSMLRKDMRPAVRLFHRDSAIEVLAWSRHAVRRLQAPLARVRANTQADLRLLWVGPPMRLVADGGPADAVALQDELWQQPQVRVTPELHVALERLVAELGLPRERLEVIEGLVREPFAPDLVERVVAALGLPEEVSGLVHEPERADSVAIARAEPTGAMEQRLERQHLKRMRG